MICHSKMITIHKNIQRFIVDIKKSRHVKTSSGITEGFNLHQNTEIEMGGVHLIGSSSCGEIRLWNVDSTNCREMRLWNVASTSCGEVCPMMEH